jgi:hypothetical protein
VQNPRDGEDWQPLDRIQSAKNIARKERQLQGFHSVRPTPAGLIQGKELLKSLAADGLGYATFPLGLYANRKPLSGAITCCVFNASERIRILHKLPPL